MNFTQRPKNRVGGAAVIPRGNVFVRILCSIFPVRGDGAFEVLRKIIFVVALVCFIYFGGDALVKTVDTYTAHIVTNDFKNRIKNIVMTPSQIAQAKAYAPEAVEDPSFIAAINENSDFRGWIKIDNTNIDYPVFQAKDNEYYLTHDLRQQKNVSGAIFADYRCDILHKPGPNGQSIVIYGHNMTNDNGLYFAKLSEYWATRGTLEYYKEHPVIEFDTMVEKAKWKVFAVGMFNTRSEFGEMFPYYNKTGFSDKDDFNNYISAVMDRSVLFADVDFEFGDSILALSTCYWPFAFDTEKTTLCAIFARKVRPGESAVVDTSKATFNNKEYRWDAQAKHTGTNWTGPVWDRSKLLTP